MQSTLHQLIEEIKPTKVFWMNKKDVKIKIPSNEVWEHRVTHV